MLEHLLRDFLYLDTHLVESYLSAVEGALYDETIVERSEKLGGGGISAGIGPISAGAKKESVTGVEITKRARMTDASRFQRLYAALETEETCGYHETMSEETWAQFGRNTLLEAVVTARFSKISEMSRTVASLTPLAEAYAVATGQSPIDEKAKEAIQGIKALEQSQSNKGVPCVLAFTGSPEYKLVAYLNPAYLMVPHTEMVGELNVFCKIQRKLGPDESLELVEFLPDLSGLPLNREQRRKLAKQPSTPPELLDTISGPAAVVVPIAIYR